MARYRINLEDFRRGTTMREQLDIARISGMTVEEARAVELGNLGSLPTTTMISIIYVLIRRIDPQFREVDMDGLAWDDIEFVTSATGHDGAADPPQPLQPLRSGGRTSSARSARTTA